MTSEQTPSLMKPLYDYESTQDAFPETDPGARPYGSKVLVQIRSPKNQTKGGIHLPHETRETELWNTQVAKVISLGPVAFCNRDTLEPWPEGKWCEPGTFVRVPKYGGDRWEVPIPGSKRKAVFVFFNDLDVTGEVTCDPLDVIAFI